MQQHWHVVNETLGENDGVCIVESAEFPKQGEHAVGGARQWCGRVGKVDHCQSGVCAAYASRKGSTLLDRRLYLPDEGFDAAHRERWQRGRIPEETRFTTKQTLALEMLQALVTPGTLRFRWGTCDEAFGRDGAFLDGVAALRRWYVAAVPHDTQVWRRRPATAVPPWSGRGRRPRKARLVPGALAPQRVDQLAAAVPPDAWHACLIKEGSTGPLVAEFAFHCGVAVRAGLPGPDVWIVVRRTWGEAPELKVSLKNAPGHISLSLWNVPAPYQFGTVAFRFQALSHCLDIGLGVGSIRLRRHVVHSTRRVLVQVAPAGEHQFGVQPPIPVPKPVGLVNACFVGSPPQGGWLLLLRSACVLQTFPVRATYSRQAAALSRGVATPTRLQNRT